MRKKQILIDAQKSGKILKVIYTVGSQPNHAREIIPLKIEQDQVFAKCLNSKSNKTFQIDKLKLLNDRQYNNCPKWDPDSGILTDYETYIIMKDKRNKLFRYFAIVFVIFILLLLLIYFIFKSKA